MTRRTQGKNKQARGQLRFVDVYSPMNDMRMVEVADNLSLSLLRARLSELNQGIEIRVCN